MPSAMGQGMEFDPKHGARTPRGPGPAPGAPRELPGPVATLLFTDVEGSTRLLTEVGSARYRELLGEHRRLLRDAFARHGGVEVDTQGDAFFVSFPTADGAVAAARDAAVALADGSVRVRIGIHTGTVEATEEGYVGHDVHKAARIAAAAHGGQVVLSRETASELGADWPLTDLGEHRVKDFSEPVWLFQLGSERFPPLRTISNTNLPRPATPILGREAELAALTGLLRDGGRLVTLTGPGGTGKTRLAIEAGTALVPEFRNGVFWVDLAALREPALVPATIGQTIGASDALAAHVGDRQMLLLLDNFEQVVDAAPQVSTLVEACPNLRVLVTSRETLQVRGEVEYAVPPLATHEAVALFCERASLEPSDTIRELCRRLDNLPLAIELAAARATVLTPSQILERLATRLDLLKGGRDAAARQRTLRSTIAWSHDLLDAGERRLFARLSVFRGGWTLEAAEGIAEADLDVLQSLVAKSLVTHDGERFAMLETIREFASEQLAGSGERDALWRRHADWFLALARTLPRDQQVPVEWLDTIEQEHENVRAAFDHLEALGNGEGIQALVDAVWRFWRVRGHAVEERDRVQRALAADSRRTSTRAYAIDPAVGTLVDQGDYEAARRLGEEAASIHRELGDAWGVARATFMLGYAAVESARFEEARPILEDALRRFEALGSEHQVMLASFNLAWTYDELGEGDRARELEEASLRRARETGNISRVAASLDALSTKELDDGRVGSAMDMIQEALAVYRQLGDVQHQLDSLSRLARARVLEGRPADGARLVAASIALHEELGLPVPLYQAKRNEATLARLHEQLDDDAFNRAWGQGSATSLDDAVAGALGDQANAIAD